MEKTDIWLDLYIDQIKRESHEEMIRDIHDMNEDKVKQVLDELDLLAMRNDLPISDGCGYSGTGLPLRVLHAWILEKRDQLIGTHRG